MDWGAGWGDRGENPDARPEEGRGPPRLGGRPAILLSDVFALPLEEGVETRRKKKLWVQGLLSYFGPGPTKGSDSRSMAMSHSVGEIFSFKG